MEGGGRKCFACLLDLEEKMGKKRLAALPVRVAMQCHAVFVMFIFHVDDSEIMFGVRGLQSRRMGLSRR